MVATLSNLKAKYKEYKQRLQCFQLKQQLERSEEILIVHQMGKVGSSSVVNALEQHFGKNIFHTHFLNPERLSNHVLKNQSKGLPIENHVKIGQMINKKLPDLLSKKKWKVITLVREPIARNISAYFQNLNRVHIKNCLKHYQNNKIELQEIIEHFFQNYPHDLPLEWLDHEIKAVFGIDVYQSNFDPNQGYHIYRQGTVDLLLMRLEDLNNCWNEAIQDFFDDESSNNQVKLNPNNVGETKEYSDLYKQFRKFVNIPEEYIDKMYGSQYAQHFYTAQELEAFKNYWLGVQN